MTIEIILRELMGGKKICGIHFSGPTKWIKFHNHLIQDNKGSIWNFEDVIRLLLDGKLKIYEEKPKLEWSCGLCKVWRTDMIDGKGYYIEKFINARILVHIKTGGKIELIKNFAISHDFEDIKDIAQKHYEENC